MRAQAQKLGGMFKASPTLPAVIPHTNKCLSFVRTSCLPRSVDHRLVYQFRSSQAPGRGSSCITASAAAAEPGSGKPSSNSESQTWHRGFLTVFQDETCNRKLFAIAVGQMLCSIATLIHDAYLPVYVSDVLGLSNTSIGAIQGASQFLCQISKGVSGVVGDLLGSQIRVLVFGTFLTLMCKPMFAALSSVYAVAGISACLYWFFFAKLLDRMSKGIREAPTKAVMNELARESGDSPDAAYGLRQTLATAGMLIGSSAASVTFQLTGQNYILTFAVATIFPVLALWWMVQNFKDELFGTKPAAASLPPIVPPPSSSTPEAPLITSTSAAAATPSEVTPPSQTQSSEESVEVVKFSLWQKAIALVTAFKPAFWQALIVVSVLYFARFDMAFISLRAKSLMPKAALPALLMTNALIQMLLTAPLAKLSGSSVHTRNRLLWAGFGFMILANAAFSLPICASPAGMFAGAALLGVHMALTHSITISMVASYMPTGEVRGLGKISGTAVSFTDLMLGFVLAASNGVAGMLSDMSQTAGLGNVGCFAGGAVACLGAGVMLFLFSTFGDLGKDDLVKRRVVKPKAA